MKKIKVALYNPYLDSMGGGERHILSILKVLEEEGAQITILWDKDLTEKIKTKLDIKFRSLSFAPNAIHKSRFEKSQVLSKFDMFFYVTDGSYFISPIKRSFIFCMVPDKNLYRMNLINRLKTINYTFIANSSFTQKWLTKWQIKSFSINPYIDNNFIDIDLDSIKKEPFILSVGRFFSHLHSKRQDILIKFFKEAKKTIPELSDFKLLLAGGLMPSDKKYFNSLKKIAGDDPSIIFYPNLDYKKLITIYKKSLIYWHAAGYGNDEEKNPESVEHFGITPLEAMSAGCLTFCYRAGGPKEFIQDGVNGFLYDTETELLKKTADVLALSDVQKNIKINAKEFVKNNYSYTVFKKRVQEVIL